MESPPEYQKHSELKQYIHIYLFYVVKLRKNITDYLKLFAVIKKLELSPENFKCQFKVVKHQVYVTFFSSARSEFIYERFHLYQLFFFS